MKKITRFSVEKLMEFSRKLGFEVIVHLEGNGVAVDVPVERVA